MRLLRSRTSGFDVNCGAWKTARVFLQGKGGITPGQALVDRNDGHVNIVVCESDYLALTYGVENLPPGMLRYSRALGHGNIAVTSGYLHTKRDALIL